MADRLFVTCEHAGNVVPQEYAPLFVGHEHLLPTHRGWDPGALLLAREMAERFGAPLYYDETTRLLADLNRSVGTPDLHSEATRHLGKAERRRLLETYYFPHRRRVDAALAEAVTMADRRRRPDRPCRVAQLHARAARQGPHRRHRHALRPAPARRGGVRDRLDRGAARPGPVPSGCAATTPTSAPATASAR